MGRSAAKRAFILDKATGVFIKKGYSSVTMSDIIKECGISRGGLYLYYSSVKDIFMEVIRQRNKEKLNRVQLSIHENTEFAKLVDDYFEMQTQRLLHMENSLKPAMYEFFLAHSEDVDRAFFVNQFQKSKTLIINILEFGADNGHVRPEDIDKLAEHVTFLIEGLGTLAMSSGVCKDLLDTQFDMLRQTLAYHDPKI